MSVFTIEKLVFDRKQAFANLDKVDFTYLQMIPPLWMIDDPAYQQMEQLPHLYLEGRVVWGCVVHANSMLWSEDSSVSCSAEVLFDPTGQADVNTLIQVAEQLDALKNSTPDDPDLIQYTKHIKNKHTRLLNYPVPNAITSLPLKSTSMFIWRLHLPNGVLQQVFPILISEQTDEATVLPARFWHKDLYTAWMDNHHFKADMYNGVRQLYNGSNPWKNASNILKPRINELQGLACFKDGAKSDNRFSHLNSVLQDGMIQEQNTQPDINTMNTNSHTNTTSDGYSLSDKGYVEASIQTMIADRTSKNPELLGKQVTKQKPWWALWLIGLFLLFKLWFILNQIF